MDLAIFLILDAIVLIIATLVLSYFFFKDIVREWKKRK